MNREEAEAQIKAAAWAAVAALGVREASEILKSVEAEIAQSRWRGAGCSRPKYCQNLPMSSEERRILFGL